MKSLIELNSERKKRSREKLKMQLEMVLALKPDPRIKRMFMGLRSCRQLGGTFEVAE